MILRVCESANSLALAAASDAAALLRQTIARAGVARLVAATGASQLEFLQALVTSPSIPWQAVELFQLDEYLGLPITHPASFSNYLQRRLVNQTAIIRYHALHGDSDPSALLRSAANDLLASPVDLAFVGIGENAHLAFNDPPADFNTEDPYLLVNLDEACRRQQVGEGWFESLSDVPTRAISMSVRQILKAAEIIAAVPEARKAQAVKSALEGPVDPQVPASILRTHPRVTLYLDRESASLLSPATLSAYSAPLSRSNLRATAHST
ncbi:MAG TPA: 6-phosphogluconolactonase [Candidatus Acidoferrum sp.]|nr:6-phosphogluconolactonase [Candidatus Acidoferrum sp.]